MTIHIDISDAGEKLSNILNKVSFRHPCLFMVFDR